MALAKLNSTPDFLVISEHWLNEGIIEHFPIEGYSLQTYFCRKEMQHGGVMICSKKSVSCMGLEAIETLSVEKDCELCAVVEPTSGLAVVGLYRAPQSDLSVFLAQMEKALSILDKFNEVLILGDFNVQFLNPNSRDRNRVCNLFLQFGYEHCIFDPTHGDNCLDNIFVRSNSSAPLKSKTINFNISDHKAVAVELKLATASNEDHIFEPRPNFSDKNLELLNLALTQVDWSFIACEMELERKWTALTETVNFLIDSIIPKKTNQPSKPKKTLSTNWFTTELRILSNEISMLKDFYETNRTDDRREIYLSARRRYRQKIAECKRVANSRLLENSDNKQRTGWLMIDRFRGRDRKKLAHHQDTPSNEEFQHFFNNIAKDLHDQLPSSNRDPTTNIIPNNAPLFFFKTVSEEELKKVISGLKNSRTPDAYGLSSYILKKIANSILVPLHYLINESISSRIFPDHLKKARLVPIFKQGERSDPANYRPISVLPVWSKPLEKLLVIQMEEFLESHHLLSQCQYGFRKKKNTSQAILDFSNNILNGFHNGYFARANLYDIKKGFDCVPHATLIKKLKCYSFANSSVALIESYLKDRGPWPFSVPQGSIAGPLLFIIFINDLPNSILPDNLIMYCDDSTSSTSHKNLEDLCETNEHTKNRFNEWMLMNRLTVNEGKTVEITFSLRNLPNVNNPPCARLLGAYIDPTLSWLPHCEKFAASLSKLTFLFRNIAKIINKESLLSIYYGLFQSKLEYAILAWGHSPHAELIFKIQRRVVRILSHKGYREDCRQDFIRLEIPTLYSIYAYKCAVYAKEMIESGVYQPPRHDHHTRFAGNNNIAPRYNRVNRTRNSANYWAIKIYNYIPEDYKRESNKQFAMLVKKFFTKKALYSLDEIV